MLLLATGLLMVAGTAAEAALRYAYSVNYFGSSISIYRADASGMLHHHGLVPTVKSPSALILHPSGKYLYVVSQVVDLIAIYAVDGESGALHEIDASPVSSNVRSVWQLGISPDGQFLYVPGRFTQDLMVFRIDAASGALSPLLKDKLPTHGDRARFVSTTPDGRFVYVSNTFSNSVSAYAVDAAQGEVRPVAGMPFATGDGPQAILIHPSGRYLYIPNWRDGDLSAYRIDAESGALSPLPGPKVSSGGQFPFGGAFHPSGRFLYVVNWAGSTVMSYAVDPDSGRLTPLQQEALSVAGAGPVTVYLDREGEHAYIPNYDDSSLTLFDIDQATGTLQNRRRIFTRPGVRRLALLEGDRPLVVRAQYAVVAGGKDKRLTSYAVNGADGALRKINSLPTEGAPELLALPPQADLVVVGDRAQAALRVYRLGTDGKLRSKPTEVSLPGVPQALRVDPWGRFLYVLTNAENRYQAYAIDHDKATLTLAESVELAGDASPGLLAATPDMRYSFVLDAESNTLQGYRYVEASGPVMFELTRHGSPYATDHLPSDMVVDPSGVFALISSAGQDRVALSRLSGPLGPPKPLGETATGRRPVDIAMHPDGRFVYVVNQQDATISHYRFDAFSDDPALRQQGEPLPVAANPAELSIDPAGRFAYLRYRDRAGITRFEIDAATGRLTHPREMLENTVPSALVFTSAIH